MGSVMKKDLTQAILHQLVLYHPTTGEFTQTDGSYLSQDVHKKGYTRVYVPMYGRFTAHRLAFLFMEGKWPENYVDHIDGNPLNNSWINLRHVTSSQNQQNRRHANKDSATGFLGVSKSGERFQSRIVLNCTILCIGTFDTAEEAHESYVKVKRELHTFGEL